MDNYILFAVGGVVLLYFVISKVLPLVRKVKKKRKVLFGRVFLNKNSSLNNELYKRLAVGALYSEQQTAYINSLVTGLDKSDIQVILSQWWGINNTNEAKDKLDYLANKGFRFYFDTILACVNLSDENEIEKIIESRFDNDEDIDKAYNQLYNLQDTLQELTQSNIITSLTDLQKQTNIGWDCGRLVFLSRLCFEAGYISENKTWEYIDKAYDLASNSFDSWKELANSYIIGRAMWGGIDCGNEGIIAIAEELLDHPKSPWNTLSFK
ncbi:MAG: DUF1266 domain-containing protein [Myroides sp.]|jgi:hypothetical protein|nr:DUF1266 domain-containing protein [Myroides sp.]